MLPVAEATALPHWEHTVGSGHAPLALRGDWQQQLRECRTLLGFCHTRLHGLLCDEMGTLMDENNELLYSFFNADQICDFLLSIGTKLNMPSTVSSKKCTEMFWPPSEGGCHR
jgi:xylan 1,4-beta-xylosidase